MLDVPIRASLRERADLAQVGPAGLIHGDQAERRRRYPARRTGDMDGEAQERLEAMLKAGILKLQGARQAMVIGEQNGGVACPSRRLGHSLG